MKPDIEVDYENALLKRKQLEEEIAKSDASAAQKLDMHHTLSKLWIAVGNMRDRSEPRKTASAIIVVNGRKIETPTHPPLSYRAVVDLAGKKGNPTVTWRVKNATAGISSGTMTPYGSFTIVPSDGLVFNVMHTDDA